MSAEKPKIICDVCGSERAEYYVGPFTYLCKNCDKKIEKIVPRYLSYLASMNLEDALLFISKYKEKKSS